MKARSRLFRYVRFLWAPAIAWLVILLWRFSNPHAAAALGEYVTDRDILWFSILWGPVAFLIERAQLERAQSDRTHEEPQVRTQFPFRSFSSTDLAQFRKQFQANDIQPRHLYSNEDQDKRWRSDLLTHNRLLVHGRSGVGKTRLCVDIIEDFCRTKGEAVTILVPDADIEVPVGQMPANLGKRNIILFIDEFHRLVRTADVDGERVSGSDVSLKERLAGCIEYFAKQATDLRVLITANTDVRTGIRPVLLAAPDFRRVGLGQLRRTHVAGFAEAVATALDVSLTAEALNFIVQRSDLTCAGIVTALSAARGVGENRKRVLDLPDLEEYECAYPRDWATVVYPALVESVPTRKAVFQALRILLELRVTPWNGLVVELAARQLSSLILSINRRRISTSLKTDLNWSWLVVGQDRVFCRSVLLEPIELPETWQDDFEAAFRHVISRQLVESISVDEIAATVNALARVDTARAERLAAWLCSWAPKEARYFTLRAWWLLQLERSAEALECVNVATTLAPNDVAAAIVKSQVHSGLGHDQEALACASMATLLDPEYYRAWLILGVVQDKCGDNESAVVSLQTACNLNPGSAKAHYSRGIALQKLSRTDEARDEHQKATTLASKDAKAWLSFGIFEERTGHPLVARKYLETALRLDPTKSRAVTLALGRLLVRLRDYPVAEKLLSDFVLRQPLDQLARQMLVYVYLRMNRPADAFAMLEILAEMGLSQKSSAWLVSTLRRAQQLGTAYEAFQASLNGNPDLQGLREFADLCAIGRLRELRDERKYLEAIPLARNVVARRPDDLEALGSLAESLYQTEEYAEASALFEEISRRLAVAADLVDDRGTRIDAQNPGAFASAGELRRLAERAFEGRDSAAFFDVAEQVLSLGVISKRDWELALPPLLRLAPRRSAEFISSVLSGVGDSAGLQHLLAAALRHDGRPIEALEAAKRSVRESPENDAYLYLLGRIHESLGERDVALEVYGRLPKHRKAIERVQALTREALPSLPRTR